MAYQTKAISANVVKNNNSNILGAGNVPSTGQASSLTLATNIENVPKNNTLPVSGVSLGTQPGQSGKPFNKQADGEYVGMIMCDNVAGSANTTLLGGAADFSQDPRGYWTGYDRIDLSIDLESGVVTKNSNNGATVLPSGLNNTTGRNADDVFAIGGEFTYMVKGASDLAATNADYTV